MRGLRAAGKRLKAFGDRIRNLGLKTAGLGTAMLAPLTRKNRQAREAETTAEPDDIIAKANRALAGLGDLLARQAARIGAQGTFVAANVLGLQPGGVTDRMADGIDKIERNTRPLRDANEISFG